ncbi:hypothetical protein DID96_32700 [Burkholderia sp. Bp8963]|uniref:DUF6708 domain-containing protein n=1 Tax=Burkholderia sp. Bp8963 TaxID=2184547 RepID=UPI000F5AC854|nr:DUF6708 domain-containing protein [Burkholderia sp. Bp8963]RQS61570.1 hypothetical protein DID96_32700 [Burkholderia sp. Bp8963]
MYLIEWMLWLTQTSIKERGKWDANLKKYRTEKRMGKYKHEDNLPGIHDPVSENPDANGSIYSFNDIYVDVCAGSLQERRGLITLVTLLIIYVTLSSTYFSIGSNSVWLTGINYWTGEPATTEHYVEAVVSTLMTIGTCALVKLFAWRLISLENFVQRRLLIRFNRVTRQVYLHRPRYAGGITILDWGQIAPEPAVGEDEAANIGRQLVLAWDPTVTGLPHLHLMFVGKTANGTSDIVNLWEFIRRYMEDGPQAVPPPKKRLTKLPWPWLSVMASLSFFRPLWRAGLRWQVACWVALVSPVLFLHATGHWLSLLLCWEPRWPKHIREAGLPGKPVPPLSTAADWPPLPKAELAPTKPRKQQDA